MLDTLIIINIAVSIYLSIELGKRRSYEERIEHYQTRPHIRVKERDYTDYDKRIEEIKDELASLHKWDGVTENGGILAKGVYNLEHSTVNLENELFPSVEEEKQIGYNEIAK